MSSFLFQEKLCGLTSIYLYLKIVICISESLGVNVFSVYLYYFNANLVINQLTVRHHRLPSKRSQNAFDSDFFFLFRRLVVGAIKQ